MARILIIEDEPILGLELTEDLESAGHSVVGVEPDGDRALLSAARHKPDLIFMDIKLSGFRDGIESAARIKGFFETPIIYVSSYPLEVVHARISRVGRAWYVQKPYDLPALLAMIEGVLSGSLPPLPKA